MAVDTEPRPPAPPAKKQIPLPAAIALLVVALAALFWFVLKPMLFPPGPTDVYEAPAPVPGAPAAPAPAPSPATPSPAAPAPVPDAAAMLDPKLAPQRGEIAVTGTVKAFTPGTNQFTMEAASIELPGKGSVTLSPARDKVVMLTNTTTIKASGAVAAKSALKAGTSVTAVGKNRGVGSPLVARRVVL